jgi:hypothetical protein
LAGLCGAGIDAGNRDIDQFGGAPPGVTAPTCRVRDGVINTVFRPTDDHRAAAVAHHINGDLPNHAGTAADTNDLLASNAYSGRLPGSPDGSDWTAALRIDDA